MEDYRLQQTGEEVQEILNGAAMQADLTAETERAEGAEQTLQGNIDAEVERAQGAEQTLQGNIDAEEERAKAAEQANADAISEIDAKIPSGASSDNKLATEEYVNDSVATNTATFRGTYNLISDLHLAIDATHNQIAYVLSSLVATADNNDYAFVQIPTSAETPTEIRVIERYKFNGEVWGFEYALNNSGFTAAQWASINSGITSNDVTKLANLPTSAELATLLNGKQDTLTFDNVPTQGSDNPVKSGGVYSSIQEEKTSRQGSDAVLQQGIDEINAKIPSGASQFNKLATTSYVDDSVATNTATFRGTYNLVSDLHLAIDASRSDIAAALGNAISTADNNDYAFVQIPTSVDTPTEIRVIERYKFNGTVWGFEYALNNSGFTAAQWAAINSGITSNDVTKLANLPTSAELATILNGKQDTLTFDNVPTQGSDNPVKSGGIHTAIANEATARQGADASLQQAIEAILLLIPSAASALNQLADKQFVNSSIATDTATFRGTYNLVSDLGLNVNATHSQIASALGNAISTADNNDYSFVQIPTADDTPTEIRKTERYKFNGMVWAYEYDLNTSGFTAAQWAAINSGITIALVGKLNDLPTNAALTALLGQKQDTLTFDNVPTLNSNNPVKSGGIYNVIKAITDLIPAEATSQNQLADKADVAAKIVAAIPSWKGQYDALTDLQAVTGAKAGDMGCVKTTDSDGHAVLTFYQYSAQGAWVVYYTLRRYAQNKPATTGTTGDYPYNGMGRIELQKNIVNGVNTLTQAMLTQQNTIYVIQYDFIPASDLIIPANCVLEFDGGSISGAYTITGNNTGIQAGLLKIFNTNVTLAGTWNVREAYPDWFGLVPNNENQDCTPIMKMLCGLHLNSFWRKGYWYFSECLISCLIQFGIKGETSIYKERQTVFMPYISGQRFIIKLGGYNDFSFATDSSDIGRIQARRYNLEGITFSVPENKKLENSDTGESGYAQRYAALMLDYSFEAYIDISFDGLYSPALYMRNSWEISFKNLRITNTWIKPTESAVYCDRADIAKHSNLSAIMIDQFLCEAVDGIIVKSDPLAGILDWIIGKFSYEENFVLSPKGKTYIFESEEILQDTLANVRSYTKVPIFDIRNCHMSFGNISLNNIGIYKFTDNTVQDSPTYYRSIFTIYGDTNINVNSINCITCPIFFIEIITYNIAGPGIGTTYIGCINSNETKTDYNSTDLRYIMTDEKAWTFANVDKPRFVIAKTNYVINPDLIKLLPVGKGLDAYDMLRYCNIKSNVCIYSNAGVYAGISPRGNGYDNMPCILLYGTTEDFVFMPKLYIPKFASVKLYAFHIVDDSHTKFKMNFWKIGESQPALTLTGVYRSAPNFVNYINFNIEDTNVPNDIKYDYIDIVKEGVTGVAADTCLICLLGIEISFSNYHVYDRSLWRSNINAGEIYKNPTTGLLELFDGTNWRNLDGSYLGNTRPSNPAIGTCFFDKSVGINKPIWWTGDTSEGKSGWVDATGTPV